MSKKDDDLVTPATKKIRFRGDLNSHYFEHHIEDIFDDDRKRSKPSPDEQPEKGACNLHAFEANGHLIGCRFSA